MSGSGDPLAAFLPILVRRRWAGPDGPPIAPRSATFAGAVLFVDVVGFTRLTERYALRGAGGAEALSLVVDACFGRITDLGLAEGGDVAYVAGDGILLVWPETDGDLGAAVARAARTGLTIQAAFGRDPLADGERLTLRASIGAGRLAALELGGFDGRWEFLLTGEPIQQITVTDRAAEPGTVLLSPAARTAAGDRCSGITRDDGHLVVTSVTASRFVPPPLPDLSSAAEALRANAPKVVVHRLAAGQQDWIAEFRDVTVLFVNLGVADDGDPERLQSAVRGMQAVLGRFEGTVYQFLADDKGTTLVGAFGIPPLAHEDDAARAVQAAEEIARLLGAEGLPPSVGMATGRAFCCVYGVAARRQYAIVGPVMNLAARLMQAAAGSVLCDQATRDAATRARTDLNFRERPAISVKGRDQPVPVFVPDAAPGPSLPPRSELTPVLGRADECRRLDQALDRLADGGTGGVVVIEGEAGIGKSRLAAYALERARAGGLRALTGAGDGLEHLAGYHAWRPVLEQVVGMDRADHADARRSQFAEHLALSPHKGLAPLLTAVMPGLALPDSETTSGMAEDTRAENTRRLLLDLIQPPDAPIPTLVLLEDAHWFDSASWTVAAHAIRRAGLLVVLTTRPLTPAPEPYRELCEAPDAIHLVLGALGPTETAAIVARQLNVSEVPPAVAELIHATAAGNPFFTEEIALALRDLEVIDLSLGRCVVRAPGGDPAPAFRDALASRGLPGTVQGVVTTRLDRLPADLQLTVKVGSVLGAGFSVDALQALYPVAIEPGALAEQLAALERRGMVREETGAGDRRYAFRHAITRDVVYGALAFAQRRSLHRAAAMWYESVRGEQPAADLALLAHHWRGAEDKAKAGYYCERAGEHALGSYANLEAIGFLTEALELSEGTPRDRQARLELLLGRAYAAISSYAADRIHLEAGLALQDERVPPSMPRLVGALLREVGRQMLHRRWPTRYVGRGAARRQVLLEQARALETLVETYFYLGDSLRSLYAALRTLNVAESAGISPELARGYAITGTIAGFIPLPTVAHAYGRRALEAVSATGDPTARHWVAIVVGVSRAGMGEWDGAELLFTEARQITDGLGDRRRWADAVGNLALVGLFRGDLAGATALLEETWRSASRERDRRYQVSSLRPLIWCLIELGRLDEADQRLGELARFLEEGVDAEEAPTRQDLYAFRGLLALRRGDSVAALGDAAAALPGLERVDPSTSFYSAYLHADVVAEIFHAAWQEAVAAGTSPDPGLGRGSRIACKALTKYARVFPIAAPAAFRARAARERALGHHRAAAQWTARSLAAAARLTPDARLAKPG